jgi:DNA invertase Pin-like site-specific DNA recombinase
MRRPAEIGRLARRGSITGRFCFAVVTDAVSGSSAIAQRMGFMKLLDKLEHDDVVIVTELDRLGRNAMDVAS